MAAQGAAGRGQGGRVARPETYLGYERAENFVSIPEACGTTKPPPTRHPATLALNDWALAGRWNVGRESATLSAPAGRIVYRFQARDLHLVLGPGPDGKPVRFQVRVDGEAPGDARGVDVAPDGSGTVTRSACTSWCASPATCASAPSASSSSTPACQAYAFTFG